jgi:hypothetical protein
MTTIPATAATISVLAIAIIMLTSIIIASPVAATTTTASAGTTTSSAPSSSGIKLSPHPIYQERAPPGSLTPINQTHISATHSGNGTLTLPNSTQTINTTSNGTAIVSFATSSAYAKSTIRAANGETVTATVYEIVQFNNPAAAPLGGGKGIVTVIFQTNSTGMLAPLNGVIAAGIDNIRPNGESDVTLWRWESGIPLSTNTTTAEEPPLMNTTTTTTNATTAADDSNAIATTMTGFPSVSTVLATPLSFGTPEQVGNETTTNATTPPTVGQEQQTIHITKDGTNSYVISGGSSSVASFDTTYRVVGERSAIRASENLIISTITSDYSSSPIIGYVMAGNMTNITSDGGAAADAAPTLPNPFASPEQITERITNEVRTVISEAENNTAQGQLVEIMCYFGMTLDDMLCHHVPSVEAGLLPPEGLPPPEEEASIPPEGLSPNRR